MDTDTRFASHNTHLQDAKRFSETDPELRQLKSYSLIHTFEALQLLPINTPGVYTLSGGHQTGKTTLIKQWIEKLLNADTPPHSIFYLDAALCTDYHQLERAIQNQLSHMSDHLIFFILDNLTFIKDWNKALSSFSKENKIQHTVLLLSGADHTLVDTVNKLFPEHQNTTHNFYLHSLSFKETILLKHGEEVAPDILSQEFHAYLQHGGFLHAINEFEQTKQIKDQTFLHYFNNIVQDCLKHGKQERYLHEILRAILKNYNEQMTWNSISRESTIEHPKTVGDYLELLQSFDVLFIQYALLEKSLQLAPKKARKLIFTDPFIFHAIQACLLQSKNYFDTDLKKTLADPDLSSKLIESIVISHMSRLYPTFYIKDEGEVDLAYVNNNRFWPIEITWSNPLGAKALKQILKYPNGRILTKTERSGIIEHIRTEPLIFALWQL